MYKYILFSRLTNLINEYNNYLTHGAKIQINNPLGTNYY